MWATADRVAWSGIILVLLDPTLHSSYIINRNDTSWLQSVLRIQEITRLFLWYRVGRNSRSLDVFILKCFLESDYPGFNRRVEYLDCNSGSELEAEPVRVGGCWPGVGVALVGMGDACAIVKPRSYTTVGISSR